MAGTRESNPDPNLRQSTSVTAPPTKSKKINREEKPSNQPNKLGGFNLKGDSLRQSKSGCKGLRNEKASDQVRYIASREEKEGHHFVSSRKKAEGIWPGGG